MYITMSAKEIAVPLRPGNERENYLVEGVGGGLKE